MWVDVMRVGRRRWVGRLSNMPVDIPRLSPADRIRFHRHHIEEANDVIDTMLRTSRSHRLPLERRR